MYTDVEKFLKDRPSTIITQEASLREVSEDIEQNPELRKELAEFLREQLFLHQGIGLSAVQLGLLKRVFIFTNPHPYSRYKERICFNPRIDWQSGTRKPLRESCLSFPGLELKISRPCFVIGEWEDYNGVLEKQLLSDLEARVFQHEMEHLNGILITDYIKKDK